MDGNGRNSRRISDTTTKPSMTDVLHDLGSVVGAGAPCLSAGLRGLLRSVVNEDSSIPGAEAVKGLPTFCMRMFEGPTLVHVPDAMRRPSLGRCGHCQKLKPHWERVAQHFAQQVHIPPVFFCRINIPDLVRSSIPATADSFFSSMHLPLPQFPCDPRNPSRL